MCWRELFGKHVWKSWPMLLVDFCLIVMHMFYGLCANEVADISF